MVRLTENGRKRVVVCAAIKYGELIICSARHYDKRMHKILRFINKDQLPPDKEIQGFIDQFGTFMDRFEAMEIVLGNKQSLDVERNGGEIKELYSEGLY